MLLYISYFLNYRFYLQLESYSPIFLPFHSLLRSSPPRLEREKLDNSSLYLILTCSCSLAINWGVLWPSPAGDFIVWNWIPWLSSILLLSISSPWLRTLVYDLGVCMSMVAFLLGYSDRMFTLGESILGSAWNVILGEGIIFGISFSWDLFTSSLSSLVFLRGMLSSIYSSLWATSGFIYYLRTT